MKIRVQFNNYETLWKLFTMFELHLCEKIYASVKSSFKCKILKWTNCLDIL